jgi:hypothetical protein
MARDASDKPTAAARRYLDDAIRRHKQLGDDQPVPRDVYDRALSRTAETVSEFQELDRRNGNETES